jgi:hypothetical protein
MTTVSGSIINLQMDIQDARHYVATVREHLSRAGNHLEEARSKLVELKDREGWRALGYPSWVECVKAEFHQSSSSVYRKLNAALVAVELSPNGGIGDVSERALRPLTKRGYSTEAKQAIFAVCQDLVGEGGKVTTGVVEAVVEGFKDMLASGATQDGDGVQTPISERMQADLLARVREKKIAHKEHINRMDKKRDYILGGKMVEKITRGQLGALKIAAIIGMDEMDRDKLVEALRLGKPIFASLWTED